MDLGSSAERLMGMNDAVWMRHANPWSGWTRLATAPVLFLALWSHVWVGWWAILPTAAVAGWLWLNPRVFPPPRHTDNWMSKGVFGERVWLNRREVPIPPAFVRAAAILNAGSVIGVLVAAVGFVVADLPVALGGFVTAIVFKIWFVDRMVRLYEVMREADPRYAAWMHPAGREDPARG